MNYLAHLFLSGDDEYLMIGNFMADFLTRREAAPYPPAIQQGIELHRHIDRFMDDHPLVRRGVRRLYPHHGKYAPVVIDIFYDYLLANNWDYYCHQSLTAFAAGTYAVLEKHLELFPAVLQRRLPLMIADDWLTGYAHFQGIAYTFERMKNRTSRPNLLDGATGSLIRDLDQLQSEFNSFFPEIQDFLGSLPLEVKGNGEGPG